MEENNVPLLKWVSSSPDLSPIETLWHEMKKLQEIWDCFTPNFCQNLVNTMPQRI
ncbi:unnamed protein product [Acanthoscelides obtectus]|uniref:Tc1-like transposase DDE domain-containing protein n=1 Tax=Acanthoscelides obtectus TaxID=200917 RepID=A0A9P0MGP3_ACAOB|nr:unnamed protein product [Acanthoscelides obtectus]CAH2015812.1 unnamed protein product [Acanthoscelides obtectus]CAK1663646.1 hypothetical protein AOBTE_LOCUS23769 [Acanthoscelides obtectus]CAK1688136.1 hypothetical protein AOBTE_LOCUS36560 [Acanthoscelides obtectus]